MAFDQSTVPRIDPERARAYVLAHGGLREKARLYGLLGPPCPDREAARELERLQNPDGGFPLAETAGNPSSIDVTCYILAVLKEMPPLAGSPMASRALGFLRRRQNPDGSWTESYPDSAMATVGDRSDDSGGAVFLTAAATYTLVTLEPGHFDPVHRGVSWLRQTLGQHSSGSEISPQTLALAAATWYRVLGHTAQEVLWCFQELQSRRLPAPELALWLDSALEVGMGGRFVPAIWRLLGQLAQMQQPDGSWLAEDAHSLEATLTALKVFQGYGLI